MKYITYYSCRDDAWHIKEIDEKKINKDNVFCGTRSYEYEGQIYASPIYDNKEQAYQSRELRFTSKRIIED